MLIRHSALLGICAGVYVIVWLAMFCVYYCYVHFSKRINVHTSVLLYEATVFVRLWGWFGALILWLILSFLLPSVGIVAQDPQRKTAEESALAKKYSWYTANYDFSDRSTFYYDDYYVLFRYDGKWLPKGRYIHNKSDSILSVYKTNLYSTGTLTLDKNSSDIIIQPGRLLELPVKIDRAFESPSRYLKKKEFFKSTWTLDILSYAEYEKDRIRHENQKQEELGKKAVGNMLYHH